MNAERIIKAACSGETFRTGIIGRMFGMKVISSPYIPRFRMAQFRFPKSKGKRTRLKWSKRQVNFRQVPIETAYVFNGDTMVIHPDDLDKIKHMVTQ